MNFRSFSETLSRSNTVNANAMVQIAIYEEVHDHGTTDHGIVFGVNDEGELHKEVFKDKKP